MELNFHGRRRRRRRRRLVCFSALVPQCSLIDYAKTMKEDEMITKLLCCSLLSLVDFFKFCSHIIDDVLFYAKCARYR
jgi:hypothetical protein